MLVVVTIMMLMLAMAASVFKPASESRRVREAARAVNIYLSTARNHAMETGRPCGVMLRRFQGEKNAVMTLDQCEIPPPYCGDTEQSLARVSKDATIEVEFWNTASGTSEYLPPRMVRESDFIQFDLKGPTYRIAAIAPKDDIDSNLFFKNTTSKVKVTVAFPDPAPVLPWTAAPKVVPYSISRSPVKSVATPLQLPAGSTIDLYGSGIADGTANFHWGGWENTTIIMFAANGSIERIYALDAAGNSTVYHPTGPVFLLVGKRERVANNYANATSDPATLPNFQDLDNLWVVIHPQTGLVTTGEMAISTNASSETDALTKARSLAVDAQSVGGK